MKRLNRLVAGAVTAVSILSMLGFAGKSNAQTADADTVTYALQDVASVEKVSSVATLLHKRLKDGYADACSNLLIVPNPGPGGPLSSLGCTPSGDGALLHGFAMSEGVPTPYLVYVTGGSIMSLPPAGGSAVAIPNADTGRVPETRVAMRLADEVEHGSAVLARHAIDMLVHKPAPR